MWFTAHIIFCLSGADTPVYAALLPINAIKPHGEFLKDRTIQQWEVMSCQSHAVAAEIAEKH